MRTSQLLGVVVAVLMLAILPTLCAAGEVDVMALWIINGKADGTITTLTTEVGKAVQFAVISDGTADYNLYVNVYDSNGAVVATPYAHLHLLNQFYEIVSYTPTTAGDYNIVASVLSANGNAQDTLKLKVNDILGCTDPKAINYNPAATKDDGSCKVPICTPGATNTINTCWDGSVKDYQVCAADGMSWIGKSNVCPIQPVCEQPSWIVPDGKVNGVSIDYSLTLLLFPTYTVTVNDYVEVNLVKSVSTDSVSYTWDTSNGFAVPAGFAASGNDQIKGKFTQAGNYVAMVTVTSDCSSTFTWALFFTVKIPDVLGCTDPKATNYNPLATKDDGSCKYAPVDVLGCTDPKADNYNPLATKDDGSCTYDVNCVPGTTEELTQCWDDSTEDYRVCAADGHSWTVFSNVCPVQPVLGCMDITALNYDPFATQDDGSCVYAMGCTDPLALNYNSQAVKDDGSCVYDVVGCTDPQANNYNFAATKDDGSCTYNVNCVPGTTEELTQCWDGSTEDYRVCAADGHSWDTFSNTCSIEVLGCTDATAKNYNPAANHDDDSCTYYILGCTDVNALNYDAAAEKDDDSCKYSDFAITSAPPTLGTIGVEYSYQVQVGGEHKALTYSLTQAPDGMSISQNGLILWVPESEGHYPVSISVTDGVRTASQKYTIYVRDLHTSLQVVKAQFTPELVSLGDQTQFTVKVENAGDKVLSDLRVTVMVYDLGIKVSSGEFNLKPGQGKTITNFIEVPGEALSGEYLAEVYIGNDQVHEVAYRQFVVG
ncbi:MAG: hypothetical protein V2A62_04695 [Candidatus Woesearchaeota archaeon]